MISRSRHAAVVLMLVLAGTAGCGRHNADPPTLYVVAKAGPLARDPLATFDESSAVVFVNVFDQMVRYPPGPGDRRGVVASWMNPDSVTWELTPRQGLRFHDGSPVRAEDVAATLNRVLTDTSSPLHPFLRSVVMAEVDGTGRVRVVTAGPVNLLMLLNFIPVVPEAGPLDHEGLPIGSGPYRVVRWSGEQIELQKVRAGGDRNPGEGGVPQHVVISMIPEEEREMEMARSLRPLILLNPSPEIVEDAGTIGLKVFSADALTAAYLICNMRDGRPTSRKEVRRTLAAAIDRQKLTDALRGEQAPATDIVPPGVFGWKAGRFRPDPSWRTPSGIPERPLHFVVIESLRPVAEEVANQLEGAGFGVEMSVQGVDAALATMNRGDFDIAMIGYSCPTGSALEFFGFAFSGRDDSSSGWNFAGYRNPRFETLLEETATTIDPAIQNDLLLEAGDVVLADLPWIPLFSVKRTMLASRDLEIAPSRSGAVEFDRVRILR